VGSLRKQHFPERYQIPETRLSKAGEWILNIIPYASIPDTDKIVNKIVNKLVS